MGADPITYLRVLVFDLNIVVFKVIQTDLCQFDLCQWSAWKGIMHGLKHTPCNLSTGWTF